MTPIKKGENSSKPNVGGPISRLGYLLLLRALKRARGSLKMLTNVDLERAPDLKKPELGSAKFGNHPQGR